MAAGETRTGLVQAGTPDLRPPASEPKSLAGAPRLLYPGRDTQRGPSRQAILTKP
ncbi:hypothetical protein SBA5_30141 [Candidatus Sulfotelmatomonas gaucii]|uniref:Uncharacterized protein n=1 Tax=Candidatus Sulfuritelmatomonas gaucii TaxID=2043161 RepID=A0A2N9LCD4_9BACT|nr:hypothetical protein SBA5_30141 [Candidatus Sulfotelmatomonas gaucii]